MTYQYNKTGFASVAALAVGALLAFAPMKAEAATCTVGSCDVTGGDGQNLSDMVIFGISNIRNQNDPNGSFTFTADFFNDTTVNALTATTVLQFKPTSSSQPFIRNLVFSVISPNDVTQSFNITDADGKAVNGGTNEVVVTLDLLDAANEEIGFQLTGQAESIGSGDNRADPGISLNITAVPLPASALLLLGGLGGLGGLSALRRRKRTA